MTLRASLAAATAAGVLLTSSPLALADGPSGVCGGSPSGPGGSSGGGSSFRGAAAAPALTATPGLSLPVLEGRTEALSLLTGAGSPQRTDRQWGIAGTDLGIAFTTQAGDTILAFGDTVACDGSTTDWRSNVLVRTSDTNYTDGLKLEQALTGAGWTTERAKAAQFIPSQKVPGVEHTTIPTAGIAVVDENGDEHLYIDYMSVRSWGVPGDWKTNYAATVHSSDDGETWELVPESLRVNSAGKVNQDVITDLKVDKEFTTARKGNDNLQMSALVQGKEDGFIYRMSTPSGRFGGAVLSRTEAEHFPAEDQFQYWDGTDWQEDPAAATTIFTGRVSELSLSYHPGLKQWVALYMIEGQGVVMRTAEELTGPWSEQRMLVDIGTIPDLYGAFVLPYNGMDPNESDDLYYVATTWSDYNVMLMRTPLSESRSARSFRDPTIDDGTEVVGVIDYSAELTAVDRLEVPASPGLDPLYEALHLLGEG